MKYYETMQLSKNASNEDIKKAYRKLSKLYHPDITKLPKKEAEEKFKELSEAYTVLSDPKTKQQYDDMGDDVFKQYQQSGTNNPPTDPTAIFEQIFGSSHDGVPDIIQELPLTLEQLYTGTTLTQQVERATCCGSCNGMGTKNGTKIDCTRCKGKGMMLAQIMPGMFTQVPCNMCTGSGLDPTADKCEICEGKTFYREKINVHVKVPPGAFHGHSIVVEGEGNEIPSNKSKRRTDICFTILCPQHELYKRGVVIPEKKHVDQADLLIEIDVRFKESLVGFSRKIQHLDETIVTIQCGGPCRHGDILVAVGKGMPRLEETNCRGDLFIKLIVEHPSKLSEGTKSKLCRLLKVSFTPLNDAVAIVAFDEYKKELRNKVDEEDMKDRYRRRRIEGMGMGMGMNMEEFIRGMMNHGDGYGDSNSDDNDNY